jgi:hypothetical protein
MNVLDQTLDVRREFLADDQHLQHNIHSVFSARHRRTAGRSLYACRRIVVTLQFLARLESNSFAGWNRDLFSCSRIPTNTPFPGLDDEDAKAAQLDSLATTKGFLHRIE